MPHGFINNNFIQSTSNVIVPGTGVENTDGINVGLAKGATFVVHMGVITAGAIVGVHAQGSADDITYNNLEGTNLVIPDTGSQQVFALEITGTLHKWLRAVITIATQNAGVNSVLAISTPTETKAPIQGATVGGTLVVNSPILGTP